MNPVPNLQTKSQTGQGKRTLTSEQTLAIETVDVSVGLAASAGCGKTLVLAHRYLNQVEIEGTALNDILVVTFTEKAARELRQRIRSRVREFATAPSAGALDWRKIMRDLESAQIDTFHAFCSGLLRRHAIEVGVDPEFSVLDEILAPSVLSASLDRGIRSWLESRNEDLIALAIDFGLGETRRLLTQIIDWRAKDDLAAISALSKEQVIDRWRSQWQQRALPDLTKAFQRELEKLTRWLLERQEQCRSKVMLDRIYTLNQLLKEKIDTESQLALLLDHCGSNARVQGSKANDWFTKEIYKQVKDRLDAFRDTIKAYKTSLEWDGEATALAAERAGRFARLAVVAIAAYSAAKRTEGLLDFDDLLLLTRDWLRSTVGESTSSQRSPAVQLHFEFDRSANDDVEDRHNPHHSRSHFRFVLVDEFQDTDPIQSEILKLLVGDEFRDGRLFLVGDHKQSIYRFRRADPAQFESFRNHFPERGRLHLTENFRSNKSVINFINALFDGAFPDYKPMSHSRETAEPPTTPAVVFHWAELPEKTKVAQSRRAEASGLARLLRDRLDRGWMIRDPKNSEVRPATDGDLVLLFRTLNDAAPYEAALAANGFDYHVVGGSAFFAQQEIHDVINLISAIEDPTDEVALAGALRSPFFGLSDEGLFWLGRGGRLIRRFQNPEELDELSSWDRAQACRARDLLTRWRARKDRVPIARVLEDVLDDTGFEASLPAEPLGGRKRANIRKLVRQARKYDQLGRRFALGDFVTRLREDLRTPPREEQASTTDEQGTAVRLMTIHQAKGLEFPIVVLVDLNRANNSRSERVELHPDLGLVVGPAPDDDLNLDALLPMQPDRPPGVSKSDPSRNLGKLAHDAIERIEEREEAKRLFYVATTRAKDVLILSSAYNRDATLRSPAMELLAERFDLNDGQFLDPTYLNTPDRPEVVHTEAEDLPRARRAGHVPTSRLKRLERAITKSIGSRPVNPLTPSPVLISSPRQLDLDPALVLPPRAARLDQMLRLSIAALAERAGLGLEEAVDTSARRHSPAASPQLRVETLDRLTLLIQSGLGDWLDDQCGLSCSPWSLPVVDHVGSRVVCSGSCVLLVKANERSWTVLEVSDQRELHDRAVLRVKLAAQAVQQLQGAVVCRAALIRHQPGGCTWEELAGPWDQIRLELKAVLRS